MLSIYLVYNLELKFKFLKK